MLTSPTCYRDADVSLTSSHPAPAQSMLAFSLSFRKPFPELRLA
jgi:hypothetical protein